ncbi:hypothetical protein KC571_01525 [candidate division WWE3 bacterium]|uniref:PilN domain-containing protein n=1 Tax=candidate division WWE3 bacterium TaxID=2053526 RepID=A0A955RQ68_UNCKA|nr:hypothetical protein [candidate division WWE3 bacterium]
MPRLINLLPENFLESQRSTNIFVQETLIAFIATIIFFLMNLTVLLFSTYIQNRRYAVQDETTAVIQEINALRPIESKLVLLHDKFAQYKRFDETRLDVEYLWTTLVDSSEGTVTILSVELSSETNKIVVKTNTPNLSNEVDFLLGVLGSEYVQDITLDEVFYDGSIGSYDIVVSLDLTTDVRE